MPVQWKKVWPKVREILASAAPGTATRELLPRIEKGTGLYGITPQKVRDRCLHYEKVGVSELIGSKWQRPSTENEKPPSPPSDTFVIENPDDSPEPPEAVAPPPPKPEIPLRHLGERERNRRDLSEARGNLRRALKRIDELRLLVERYEQFTQEPIKPIRPVTMQGGRRTATAVALLSDVHAEERVVPTEAIRNEYSLCIAEQRVARFFQGVSWLIKHTSHNAFNVPTLILWLGGDLISGDIHDELLETTEVPPAEAMLAVRNWIVAGIHYILRELPDISIVVPCSYGNHGRTTKTNRHSTGFGHSWEWVLYQILGHDFQNEPRVSVHTTRDEMQYVRVFDFTLAFHHGFNIKYKGGLGGVTVPAIKACHRWDKWRDCDIYHFGHFHQLFDLPQIVFNGSVVGPSPYGFAIGATPEPPRQSFYLLDSKRGKTMSCPVWVAE